MNVKQNERIIRMIFIIVGILGFIFVTLEMLEADDDVYNFYFQKGAAPQTVVQGKSGQSTSNADLEALTQEEKNQEKTLAPILPVKSVATAEKQPEVDGFNKDVTLSLGYGKVADPIGSNMAYTLGAQYNFNRFLGMRLQGRLRNLQTGRSESSVADDANHAKNRMSGMLAIVFTPLHVDLLGHRFLELSAFAGAETYRKIGRLISVNNSLRQHETTGAIAPVIGISALLGFNENAGIELMADRSDKSNFFGGSLAVQF